MAFLIACDAIVIGYFPIIEAKLASIIVSDAIIIGSVATIMGYEYFEISPETLANDFYRIKVGALLFKSFLRRI